MTPQSRTRSIGDGNIKTHRAHADQPDRIVTRVVGKPEMFRLQKRGNVLEECEDAAEYFLGRRWVRAAVSDGATEAVFSRRWADLLVQHAVSPGTKKTGHNPERRWDLRWLATPGGAFRDGINIGDLPWNVQDKVGRGSFATLMTLTIDLRTHTYFWRSVGDSCLVVVSQNRPVIVPEEYGDPSEFGTSPHLIGSNPTFFPSLEQGQRAGQSTLPVGETTFLLMTDALGSWFARAAADSQMPWQDLLNLPDIPTAFEDFIEARRNDGHIRMRNDDVALVRLTVSNTTGA